jgi:alpha,alpha-trehalase
MDHDARPVPEDATPGAGVDLSGIDAFVCDLDGVVTRTATTHMHAWKRMFDDYLTVRGDAGPFTQEDYRRFVDGRPRYDGVDTFLHSRGIALPWGLPTDVPDAETVCGLGNRKNTYFWEVVRREGVERIEPTVEWLRQARARGLALGLVTSSENSQGVLKAAGIEDLFPVRVDGLLGRELGLPGKPDPAYFLEAARRLGVPPTEAAVVEDAVAGVEAGRRGGFGLVVGIGDGTAARLREAGADVVVEDLSRLPLPDPRDEAAA